MPQYEKSHNAFDNGLNESTEAIALVCCSRTLVGLAGLLIMQPCCKKGHILHVTGALANRGLSYNGHARSSSCLGADGGTETGSGDDRFG